MWLVLSCRVLGSLVVFLLLLLGRGLLLPLLLRLTLRLDLVFVGTGRRLGRDGGGLVLSWSIKFSGKYGVIPKVRFVFEAWSWVLCFADVGLLDSECLSCYPGFFYTAGECRSGGM